MCRFIPALSVTGFRRHRVSSSPGFVTGFLVTGFLRYRASRPRAKPFSKKNLVTNGRLLVFVPDKLAFYHGALGEQNIKRF
jgi:hypothetical protein